MGNKSRTEILVHNTTYIYLGKIVTQFLGLIVTILVIRKLSVELYGIFNFIIATYILFSVFSVSPLVSVMNRYIPEFKAHNDKHKLIKLILTSFLIYLILICLTIFLFILFSNSFERFFKINNFNQYLLPYIFYVISISINTIIISIITSFLLHKYLAIFTIIGSLVRAIAYFIFIHTLTVNIMLIIEGSITYFLIIPSIIIISHNLERIKNKNKTDKYNINSKKRVFRYGFFSSLNELGAGIVGKASDFFIISAIGSQYAVGLYSFGYRIFGLVYKILPLKNFLTVMRPIFFQKFSNKINKDEFIQIYNLMIKMMIPVFLLPILYFIVFGRAVIFYVFDPKYLPAYWVTIIVLLSGLSVAIFYPLGLVIQLYEKMEYALYSKTVVVFSIFAGIYFMKIWGIIGVAVATLLGDLFRNLLMFFMMRRKAPIVYKLKEMVNYLYITIFLVCLFYFFLPFVTNLFILLIFSGLFLMLFVLFLIIFHPFNKRDLIILEKISNSSRILKKFKPIVSYIYLLKPKFTPSEKP